MLKAPLEPASSRATRNDVTGLSAMVDCIPRWALRSHCPEQREIELDGIEGFSAHMGVDTMRREDPIARSVETEDGYAASGSSGIRSRRQPARRTIACVGESPSESFHRDADRSITHYPLVP
jgi:hypothetical protein